MVLKLSRTRQADVGLTGNDNVSTARRRYAGSSEPHIFTTSTLSTDPDGEMVAVEIPMPAILDRQAWNAQDPLASVYHYLVFMYVVLPALFGIRMCFQCPDCGADDGELTNRSAIFRCSACSDYLGSNSKCMGGFAGLATGMGFATEMQGEGTPHGHGFVSLANMYQHHTLEEIGQIIEANARGLTPDIMLNRVIRFIEHLQREDHYDNDWHQQNLPTLEREFHNNNDGPKRNQFLSARPRYFYEEQGAPYLWSGDKVLNDDARAASQSKTCSSGSSCPKLQRRAEVEAAEFREAFETDVQFIFSHVQHHWHKIDDRGKRVPMKYCQPASRKCKRCKRDFPKKVLRDAYGKIRMDKYRARIVCKGVAAELDLRISGRRNALGSVAGRRRCEWFSGTAAILAHVARSNTNLQCNYRVPITAATHDKDCKSPSCTISASVRRICLIAQRAMKQMTGYFGGYISKKQKIGQFELKKSVSTLPLLQEKLENRNLQSASAQLAHVVNRMFTTLEGKGILRVATEEFLLSSQYKPHDPLAAEFIRTFRERNFPGKFFLERYDALCKGEETIDVRVMLPKNALGRGVEDVVSLYGFRPPDVPDLFYLSPWEFVQWVKPERVRQPSEAYRLTKWTAAGRRKLSEANGEKLVFEPGEDYVIDEAAVQKEPRVYSLPSGTWLFRGTVPMTYEKFQQGWTLRLRQRPVIPAPECCPMPSRRKSKEMRSKIYSVYLRPWTLARRLATSTVPFLGDLNVTWDAMGQEVGKGDIRQSWKQYLGQVLPHAFHQVRNFMLASIAEGRSYEEDEDGLRRGETLRNHLSIDDVENALIFRMPERPENTNNEKDKVADNEAKVALRVWSSANLAVQLANLTHVGRQVAVEPAANVTKLCWSQPAVTSKGEEQNVAIPNTATLEMSTEDWTVRYKAWYHEVFVDKDSKTPNDLQAQVLHLVHDRRQPGSRRSDAQIYIVIDIRGLCG